MSEPSAGGANKQDYTFGQLAIRENLCTFEQVKECLDIQAKLRTVGIEPKKLGDILIEKGYLTPELAVKLSKVQATQSAHSKLQIPGYELLGRIGAGAMGVVYKAKQVSMDRVVAIKVLSGQYSRDPGFVERFVREARAVAKLNHENVISGIDVGEVNGLHYFIMEYVDGIPVSTVMRREGKLPEKRCLEIAQQVAKALSHAHRHGIVHRDVKPENIMITASGVAKLCDLGLAKSTKSDARETMDGQSVGTPNYISPEQARAEEKIDIRTDIYSLGCSLYHMATGTTPFTGPNPMVVMTKHVTEYADAPQKRNPALSDGFNALIVKMMGKHREERHPDPEALLRDIDGLVRVGEPELAAVSPGTGRALADPLRARGERNKPPTTVRLGGLMPERKPPVVPVAIGAAVLVGVGLAYLMLGGRGASAPPPPPRPQPVFDSSSSAPLPPPSAETSARVKVQIESFRKVFDAGLEADDRADRYTFPYAKIVENVEVSKRSSDFVALSAWQEELDRFVKAADAAIAKTSGWEELKGRAKAHSAAGRYSLALDEANKLKDVFRWFRAEAPAVPTAVGKEREEFVTQLSTALREAHYQTMKQAQAAFANPKTRDDAYGILDTLVATGAPDKRPEVEAERRRFIDQELSALKGEAALPRIADLKKLHAGNGNTLAYLDQVAAAVRQGQLDAVKAASARALESFERDYKPRFGPALQARDLPAARRAMHELLFSPGNPGAAEQLLAAPAAETAAVRSYLDPSRAGPPADVRKLAASCEAAAASSRASPSGQLHLDLRKLALLDELLEQALEGAKAVSRDSGKFKTGYSPALQGASAAEPAPRKDGELALSLTPRAVLKLSPKGLPPETATEDDIVNLAKRAPSAASDPYFALKAYLLYEMAGDLKSAKSWYEKLGAPNLKLGLEGADAKLSGVASESMELAAKSDFGAAWDLYHKKKDIAGGKKKFQDCVEKYAGTDYMKSIVPTLGKSRIQVVEAMFGATSGGGGGGGGAGGGGASPAPTAANLKNLLLATELRELGGGRYEVVYTFREDRELGAFTRGNGGVNAVRDPLGGARLDGNGTWYWAVPLKGNVSIDVQFRMMQPGPFGLVVCGEGDAKGYAGVADLPVPGVPPLDALLRFPMGGAQLLTSMVAQAPANLGTQAGANQASLNRMGTRLRYTLNRSSVEGENAQYTDGRVGVAIGTVPLTVDRVVVIGEIDAVWLDAALKKGESGK